MRFSLEAASGESLCFDGSLVAQATQLRPGDTDGLMIARVFRTLAGQWVFQLVRHTWECGEISWSAAWTYATKEEARRDVSRRLSAFPRLARVLGERLGWPAQPPPNAHFA